MNHSVLIDYACLGAVLILASGWLIWLVRARRANESNQHYLELEKQLRALKFLDEMAKRYPGRSSVYWEKGKIYEALGRHEEALQYYQVAQQIRNKSKTLEYVNA